MRLRRIDCARRRYKRDGDACSKQGSRVTVLLPMTEEEFVAFAATAVPAYAANKVMSGQWAKDEALDLSRKSLDELLPHGLATAGNYLFTIRDSREQASVGTLWFAVQDRAGKRIGYVYDLNIKPEHRRKGHARRALLALEDSARSLGLLGLALHVFGHNTLAQGLYAKLGYRPTNISMFKAIDKPGI
jgi:ribosomal protein S18 acetylase RimI-like enzyme